MPESTGATNMTTDTAYPIAADESVTIRPIHPSDNVMEGEFIRNLSAQTKHYRFLGGVKELPPAELKRLCDVDGRHSMAFVATVKTNGHETEIGVSRYAEYPTAGAGELAITIADAWQHKGLAQLLLKQLITYAKTHGIKQLYSVEFADNTAMRELAREFGMSVRRDPGDANQVIYSLTL
jgi:RimJ/RimL family protein N-acetyltransferase